MFRGHVKNKYYVDKSDLIEYTNSAFGDDVNKCICASRPRRFGKSCAAVANAAGAATPMATDERKNATRSSESAVGDDAGLDTMAEIVHFCEIRKYTV